MTLSALSYDLTTEHQTETFGKALAGYLTSGLVIYLIGPLGAGKTRLAQAIIHGLGFDGHVKSPTYTMVESYPWPAGTIYHFDLYRLMDPMELEYMGIQDYFEEDNVILIEWPDKGAGMIAKADIEIQLNYAELGRHATIICQSQSGEDLIKKLKQTL